MFHKPFTIYINTAARFFNSTKKLAFRLCSLKNFVIIRKNVFESVYQKALRHKILST